MIRVPGRRKRAVLLAPPADLVGRYLTVGGATVDLTATRPGETRAHCTGHGCTWQYTSRTGGHIADLANEHAAKCRAMPTPQAAAT